MSVLTAEEMQRRIDDLQADKGYIRLIEAIFGEQKTVISREQFIEILPKLLKTPKSPITRWTEDMRADVITRLYGIDGLNRMTAKEIGLKFGVSGSQIGHVKNKCLRILRRPHVTPQYAFLEN